jgi:hypothetical protein
MKTLAKIVAILLIGSGLSGCSTQGDNSPVAPQEPESLAMQATTSTPLAKGSASLIEKISQTLKDLVNYASQAAKYLKGSAKYIAKIVSAVSDARDIGQYYNDLALGRNPLAEQAFNAGWSDGIRDAKRFITNPSVTWYNWDKRAVYAKSGSIYGAAYDAGWAGGWKYQLDRIK